MNIAGNLLSVVYIALFLLSGLIVSRAIFPNDRLIIRLWLGGVAGLLMLMWYPAVFSFLMGFTVLSHILAACLAALTVFFAYHVSKKKQTEKGTLRNEKRLLLTLLPFLILGIILFITHTLKPTAEGLCSGQSTFGDMPLHLGLITSLSQQTAFPPNYSILPGTPVGYPFLCDSVSSTFYTLGASLRFAYLLPAVLAFTLVLLGIYLFFESWLQKPGKTTLATLLFLIGGGLGFVYFMNGLYANPSNFTRIFTEFYQTPTNLTSENIYWVNPIADMLIPQRATLFGWSMLFPALFLLKRSAFDGKDDFIPLAVLVGCMPLIHTHSFLAVGMISIVYFARALIKRENVSGFLRYAFLALVIAAPQLLFFTFKQAGSFLTLNLNWVNSKDSFLWFYIKNLGLLFILLPIAFLNAPKRDKEIYSGVLLLWALAELIQFQPNAYDNNKLLFVWFAFSCGIVASLLIDLYEKLGGMKGRKLLASFVLITLMLSGVLTLGRELNSEYVVFSNAHVEASEYILQHTPADAVFLTTDNHNNTVAALTGRNIVCGSSAFLYYHGFNTTQRKKDVETMFRNKDSFKALAQKYSVDYIFLSDYEMGDYAVTEDDFSDLPLVYSKDGINIFAVSERALAWSKK